MTRLDWITTGTLALALVHGSGRAAEPRPVVVLPSAAPIPDEIAARIEDGEGAFRVQNYGRVVEILDRLAGHPALEGRPEHIRVLEMIGASHWFMEARDSARLVFGQLLREAPFHRLDAFVYPPELLEFVERRRTELITGGIIPATPAEDNTPRRVLVREVERDDTPGVVFLAPFGVGQFVNDEPGKGTAMAIVQGLGAATMIASYIGIETLKVGDTNRIPVEDGGQARLLNALWFGGLAVFGGAWAYAIIDGFANRKTEPVIQERFELLDQRGRPDTTLRLVPGPGDLGGLGLEVGF